MTELENCLSHRACVTSHAVQSLMSWGVKLNDSFLGPLSPLCDQAFVSCRNRDTRFGIAEEINLNVHHRDEALLDFYPLSLTFLNHHLFNSTRLPKMFFVSLSLAQASNATPN